MDRQFVSFLYVFFYIFDLQFAKKIFRDYHILKKKKMKYEKIFLKDSYFKTSSLWIRTNNLQIFQKIFCQELK